MDLIRTIIKVLIIGVVLFCFNCFFYQLCIVHGSSMEPTLNDNDIVLIKKFNLQFDYNDIVVIKKNKKILIKRIIGKPNDKIRIDENVYVNDKRFDDLLIEDKGIYDEVTLGVDEYFVLGDNRQNSIDSRFEEIGNIKKNEIIGKVVGVK